MSASTPEVFEVLVPHQLRRTVLTTGEGSPMPLARGDIAGRPGEVVGAQARLELRRGGVAALRLDLPLWTAEAREGLPGVHPTAKAGRFTVTRGEQQLPAEVARVKPGHNPLAEAARYWSLSGPEHTLLWGDGGAPDEKHRDRVFRLWRDRAGGPPLVEVGFERAGDRRVEAAVAAIGTVRAGVGATASDVEVAVLLAVGGFNVELRGRNARLRRAGKWLAEYAEQKVTDSPFVDGDLDPVDYGP